MMVIRGKNKTQTPKQNDKKKKKKPKIFTQENKALKSLTLLSLLSPFIFCCRLIAVDEMYQKVLSGILVIVLLKIETP